LSQPSGSGIKRGPPRSYSVKEGANVPVSGIDPYMFLSKQKLVKGMFSGPGIKGPIGYQSGSFYLKEVQELDVYISSVKAGFMTFLITCRASAIFVGVYEPVKQKLLKSFPENLSALAHLTAGAVGGAASSIVRVPTEVVKQRMQTGQFNSAPDAVRLIVAKEGFKGLYAGYGSFLLRDLPFDAIQFCIYEQLRIGYKRAASRDLNDPENAIIGAFAGAITGAITTPLDVVKTRLMVQGSANQYKGILHSVGTIIREEGTPALFKGIGPRVLWIGIGGSIFFSVLERTKQTLAQKRPVDNNSNSLKLD
ncbi:unnamed protein product, partial [Ilex paraguariensis]